MKKVNTLPLRSACALLSLFICSTLDAANPPEGFTALFNGQDLKGWHGDNPHVTTKAKDRKASLNAQAAEFVKFWSVENGELVNNGAGPYATTDQAYGDFELMLDYKVTPGADSGIYLRSTPQVQIWDTTEAGGKWKHGAAKGSGGLWNNPGGDLERMPLVHADHAPGEWNSMRIRLVGSRTWIWLNDKLIVDGVTFANYWNKKSPLPARGPIHLQTHGGEMRWRNLYIRDIGGDEANTLLSELDTEGFKSIFNGTDFTGWQGAVDGYPIRDGVIHSSGGNVFTKKQYSDFTFRMEFRVAPGANNGLAIRYPGTGDPAYSGMCELQVLDNTSPKYANLDARQFHASVYGKAAATRGYQRPVNEWNYQVVRVQGSAIQVELNGAPILDADLSKIAKFMNAKFKAEFPEQGYLGFAGHGSGVAFRDLWLKDNATIEATEEGSAP
ncbi:MAG: DUF1080 domain-containing protein [Kiritimatiellae bacterium]|nr:DUF1080 domain-containing protein [Kiritimatiellia bacterium]